MKIKNKKTSWGDVSIWYNDLIEKDESNYQKTVILPNLLRIIDPKENQIIADLACGQGFFSRSLAELGAKITACDISPELINLAKKNNTENIVYHIASAENISFLKNNSVDLVLIVLALQNIENINKVFKEVFRVLKNNGRFVFVLNHPAFRIPQKTSWYFDQEKNVQYRLIENYLSESSYNIVMHPSLNQESPKTISFHRPLQVYFKALFKNDLMVSRFEEWISNKQSQNGPRKKAEDKARKEIPLFLCMEAKKIVL